MLTNKKTEIGEMKQNTMEEVKLLEDQLREMPVDMRLFSLTLRSLYAENSVGTRNETAIKFRKLRDDTRNDAMVYLKCILPLSTKFVACISDYFEYYETLQYDEWCTMLPDILKETIGYKELCNTILKMHEHILTPLKKRQDEASVLITEFKDLSEEYEKRRERLGVSSSRKRDWALYLAFIPRIGNIVSKVLLMIADEDLAQALANKKQCQINQAASMAVSGALIPALQNLINAIQQAAGFFSSMEQELMRFEEKAQNDPMQFHFRVMKTRAKGMKSICQNFYSVIPEVRTDFLAIPTSGTDQNYVDEWLEKQKKTIEENCKVPRLAKKLVEAITQH
ncbi:uncharacterized protein [Montipora capricornis]|uniref:uncharacterized protein isoform X1 n=1 Tax=Montipora capricornis TaxID=246305 RepID=UPI0035F12FA5